MTGVERFLSPLGPWLPEETERARLAIVAGERLVKKMRADVRKAEIAVAAMQAIAAAPAGQ